MCLWQVRVDLNRLIEIRLCRIATPLLKEEIADVEQELRIFIAQSPDQIEHLLECTATVAELFDELCQIVFVFELKRMVLFEMVERIFC